MPGGSSPGLIATFFDALPPLTPARQAALCRGAGRGAADAGRAAQAREAWRTRELAPEDELRLISRFGSALTPGDHDTRMDALLWANATTAAVRQLGYVARRAGRCSTRGSPIAPAPAMPRPAARRRPGWAWPIPGYLADRATWRSRTGSRSRRGSGLATRRPLAVRPTNIEKWYEALLSQARNAYNDRQ